MKVKLHTQDKKYFSDSEWDQIHSAFLFFFNKYEMDRYTVPVYVTFHKQIDGGEGVKTSGLCVTKFKRYGMINKASHFIVKICANNSMHKIFEVIFHEMTHVLQELRGDFDNVGTGGHYYKNTYYSVDKLNNASYNEYRDFPWEVEARTVSKQLLGEWYEQGNDKRSFWQKLMSLIFGG
jgi:hypothetical protein